MYNSRNDMYGMNRNMSIMSEQSQITTAMEKQTLQNEKRERLLEQSAKVEARQKNYRKFVVECKDYLLGEALHKIMESCFPGNTDTSLLEMSKNICHNFVVEEGADKLLNIFATKSLFLSEMANIVNSSYKSIIEGCKNDCNEEFYSDFTIKNSELEKFYNKLDQMDYGNMANSIRSKVAKAEEEFVQANINDKIDMEKMAEKTKEKIDQVKVKDEDTEKEIKQEFARMYRGNVNKIMDRKKSIFESMVERTSTMIMKDESLLEQYTTESGKFNTPKAIETAEVMYTFLEMVNTANIKKVDEKYISSVLKSI